MTLVIDASVAVKFVTLELGSQRAKRYLESEDELIAPDLVHVETANALWKKVRDDGLLEVHAERALADLPEFFTRIEPATDYLTEAFSLSFRLRHAVYDCIYLALAMKEGVTLITADKKFWQSTKVGGLEEHVEFLVAD